MLRDHDLASNLTRPKNDLVNPIRSSTYHRLRVEASTYRFASLGLRLGRCLLAGLALRDLGVHFLAKLAG